uniref:Interleukin-1 beta n=1 Tax=Cyprinus carpio TaxID=7962 RepID=A0A8C2JX15_CYPCA
MLLHNEREGKHSYKVNGFFNYNKGKFASKGDKVIMINNTDVEDLTPQAFAELLVEGSPLLTIHHSPQSKTEECESEEINVRKKEPTVMRFSMMMVREEDLKATGVQPSPEWEDKDIEDDCFSKDNLLLVSMAETKFSVVVARGCDPYSPCNSCGGMNCQFNEVVVLPSTAEITLSKKQMLHSLTIQFKFLNVITDVHKTYFSSILSDSSRILMRIREQNNVFIKSFLMEKYVTPENQHMLLKDTMSAKITLYYYTITTDCEGVPVVLNFSGTENFFCCTTKQGEDKKILTVMNHNKKDLKRICPDDREKWSLVFYMSCGRDNLRRFESALYRGWFIYTQRVDDREVDMQKEDQFDSKQDSAFSFIILSENGSC